MTWILFIILLNIDESASITKLAEFNTMDKCFAERQNVVKQLGRPIVNYQAICILKQ